MTKIKFTIDYDDQPDDIVGKIGANLIELGYMITISDEEANDNGSVDYFIQKIEKNGMEI